MIAHVVLFQPRADLPDRERVHFLDSLALAATQIPSIRRFQVGRRVRHGLPGYEQAMAEAFDYAAIAEFDDLEGLKSYLSHPAHHAIGRHFAAWAARALAYDFDMVAATAAGRLTQEEA